MNLDAISRQISDEGSGSMRLDDLAVTTHSSVLGTFCAEHKHKMSLDPPARFVSAYGMDHVGQRILKARGERGWSQAKLAAEVNQAPTTISSWERGRTEPGREDVRRVANALGVPVTQLELGAERRQVPVVSFVGAGDAAHYYDTSQGPFGYVDAPDDAGPDTVAGEIKGGSIGRLFDGWLIFWDEVHSPVTPDQHGELCVVGLPDGRVLVKWLQAARDGRFHLLSQAEDPMFDQEVAWAAKVTNMRPR